MIILKNVRLLLTSVNLFVNKKLLDRAILLYSFPFFFRWTGAIFDKNDGYGLTVFGMAVSRQNAFSSQFRMQPLIKEIPSMDAAKVEKAGWVQLQEQKTLTRSHFI